MMRCALAIPADRHSVLPIDLGSQASARSLVDAVRESGRPLNAPVSDSAWPVPRSPSAQRGQEVSIALEVGSRSCQVRRSDHTGLLAKASVAVTSSCVLPGSSAEWPASGTMRRFASGQARCSAQALIIGQTTS
jgi:hypothetical protein